MKDFFRNKKKFLLVVMLMVVTLTGCSVPRGQNGKTYVNSIYTIKDVQVKRGEVDIPDDKELQKKYKDYKADDLITIEKTTFSDAIDEGWFNGLIVWPIAFLINFVADFSDAGIGIIAATFLIQLLIFLFSIKSQVASQRMQAIQPEMNKIQAKYAGKTDDRSKMQQAQEMQALYSKYKINPFGTLLVTFIQFPVILGMYQATMRAYSVVAKYAGKTDDRSKMQQAQEMQALYSKYKINPFGTLLVTFIQFPVILGMYQATMRAYSVVTGSFQGINLAKTPIEGFNLGNYWYVVIFVLMVAFQLLSFKMPQWLQEHRKKKLNIKEKKYAEPKKKGGNGMMGSMNMMMYMSTGMIAIFAINWPLGMSFYWLVNSLARVIQNIVIHKFFIKD